MVTHEAKKEDRIGHVQKRLVTALRSCKNKRWGAVLSDGKGTGGKGRLTDPIIDRMHTAYGYAICNNKGDQASSVATIWVVYHLMIMDPPEESVESVGSHWLALARVGVGSRWRWLALALARVGSSWLLLARFGSLLLPLARVGSRWLALARVGARWLWLARVGSRRFALACGVSRCFAVPRGATRCLALHRSASQCLAVLHGAPRCLAVPRGTTRWLAVASGGWR